MFNAVNGLIAGGLVSAHDINNANVAFYSTLAGVGFFCGSIANRNGLRLTLGIGGFGYFLYIFGYALDIKAVRRPLKAKINLVVLLVITMAIWGGGCAWQRTYTRYEVTAKTYVKLDFKSSVYIRSMFLYIFYGVYDAAWQTSVYWFMGALTDNSRKLANFTGFYKGV